MVSPELAELARRGDTRRAREHAFLPDQDAHINALIGVLRQLADGVALREVLARAVTLGLRYDAFPDLLDLTDPPRPAPQVMVDVAINAVLALANLAESTAADARGMIEAYGYGVVRT